jgi:hypothetical protein
MAIPIEQQQRAPGQVRAQASNDISIDTVAPANDDGSIQPTFSVSGFCVNSVEIVCEIALSGGGTQQGSPASLTSSTNDYAFRFNNVPKVAAPNFHTVTVKPKVAGAAQPDSRNITVEDPA